MLLKNLEYEMLCRLTQPNDFMDLELNMLTSQNLVAAGNAFASELSHNILLGLSTLTDPGYVAKFVDTDGVSYQSSEPAVADYYETETQLISESTITNNITVSADLFISTAQILFDRGGGQDLLSVLLSRYPQGSPFSEFDGTVKGIKIDVAGGNLTITTTFRFTVLK